MQTKPRANKAVWRRRLERRLRGCQTIEWHFVRHAFVVVALALLVQLVFTVGHSVIRESQQRQAEAVRLAVTIADVAADHPGAQHHLSLISLMEDVTPFTNDGSIAIYWREHSLMLEPSGRFVSTYDLPPTHVQAVFATRQRDVSKADGMVRAVVPISLQGAAIGAVVVAMPNPVWWRTIGDATGVPTLALMLALIVIVPYAGRVGRRFVRPLNEMSRAVRRAVGATSQIALPDNIEARTMEERLLARSLQRMVRQNRSHLDRVMDYAYVDELTGLPNRRRFYEDAPYFLSEGEAGGGILDNAVDLMSMDLDALDDLSELDTRQGGALLIVDLHDFRTVNDVLGHATGDRLLVLTANRIRETLRERFQLSTISEEGGDTKVDLAQPTPSDAAYLARIGGDTFAVLVPELAEAGAKELAGAIGAAIGSGFEIDGLDIAVGADVGVALYPDHGDHVGAVLVSAELALRVAKARGGGDTEIFAPSMMSQVSERAQLLEDMREALDTKAFVPFFQPQVDCRSGVAIGYEALARWEHPRLGYVSPGAFIPAAEECGMIGEIGDMILEKSCREALAWPVRPNGKAPRLSVNISMRQIERPDFGDWVRDVMKRTGFPANRLELELTETVAMSKPDMVRKAITPLRELGITFAIDDFGTGYSSLSQLTALPFDILKIDRSFVNDLETSEDARSVSQTIIGMAESLGFEVIAEGVETPRQAAILAQQGCLSIQGFLFARPMPAPEALEWAIQNGSATANPVAELHAELSRAVG